MNRQTGAEGRGQRNTHPEDEREEGKTSLHKNRQRETDRQTQTDKEKETERLAEHPEGSPEGQGLGRT